MHLMNRHFQDLNPLVCGEEVCKPGHSFGPAIRHYTLLHYIRRGSGVYETGGVRYPVCPGQAFLILPEQVTTYTADRDDPWEYCWIGFDGFLSARFSELPPVFPLSESLSRQLSAIAEDEMTEYRLAGVLFALFAELFARKNRENDRIRRICDYVQASYMQPDLRVEQIATQMHLDRRYLSRLFRKQTGQSVQEYLISVRMEEARRCLAAGMGVGETAACCGYADPFNFSKMFRRQVGVSPTEWKRAHGTT